MTCDGGSTNNEEVPLMFMLVCQKRVGRRWLWSQTNIKAPSGGSRKKLKRLELQKKRWLRARAPARRLRLLGLLQISAEQLAARFLFRQQSFWFHRRLKALELEIVRLVEAKITKNHNQCSQLLIKRDQEQLS